VTPYRPNIERAIAELAAMQRGYITRWQLLDLGLSVDAIRYRLRVGRLHRVFPCVYAVGHRRDAPMDLAMAAVLACGEGAVLSHRSAAALWGFVDDWKRPFEVTAVMDRRPRGIKVHRTSLGPVDKKRTHGIPVTSAARTVLDYSPAVPNAKLPRFVNDARQSKWMSDNQLAEAIERYPYHPGAKLVRPVLEGGVTRSPLEDRFVRFIEQHGLPMPELNFPMGGRILDAFYPEERVIVEVDSWRFHKDRQTFELDREKDAEATANGLVTVRITDDRMDEREARRLEAILASRR
jgi:hypothetical protein